MELVVIVLTYKVVLVYTDDTIVYGRLTEEHLKNLDTTPGGIGEAKMSPSKNTFTPKFFLFSRTHHFIGWFQTDIQTERAKKIADNEYPISTKVKQVLVFVE